MEQPVQNWSAEQDEAPPGLQAHLAFHLTGKRPRGGLAAIDPLDLRPAWFAGYRDLNALRYDFPLVLVQGAEPATAVQSLSGLFDGLFARCADGAETDRLRRHGLRLEREIRTLAAQGSGGSLTHAWAEAERRLARQDDRLLQDSLHRLRAALDVDGALVDCNAATAFRLCRHLWQAAHDDKARRFRARLAALHMKLTDILRADLAHSEQGRSAESLAAAFGATQRDAFDFAALSRLLAHAGPKPLIPEARRQRIVRLIALLAAQRFFPAEHPHGEALEPYGFVFDNCAAAIAAHRERLPQAVELAKAMAMAELEVDGAYDEARHDAFFADFAADSLDTDLDLFPDYLVCVRAAAMQTADTDAILEACSAGLRAKVVVETADILEPSSLAGGNLALGWRSKQLARAAMDLNAFYVVQASSACLFRLREAIFRGMAFSGPALFSVYAGSTGHADLPSYLLAAAATESRAFPTFVFDPSAGTDWASRFRLDDNPQVERDWPIQTIAFSDEAHQRQAQSLCFTLVDFVAGDRRYAKHFARVPRAKWTDRMVPAGEFLVREPGGPANEVPYLLMADRNDVLHKVIVDERLIREARRCAEAWRSLQELGGIHNSHAERLLAQERKVWAEQAQQAAVTEAKAPADVTPITAAPAPAAAAAAAAPEPAEPAKSSDDPYIETPRCTTCNECTQINGKMFAYDANKQAYIADPDAGTYRQLVEAAESCQVAIIHPGKPRNPNEPGLDELMQRAEAFR
jgi:hypothetical protein